MAYTDFITQNVAPYASAQIGVYNSSGTKVGKIPLGNFKPTYGTRLYRFGFCCDSHLGCTSLALAPDDLQRAYTFFNDKESVDFVVMCGDLTHNGTSAQFQSYQTIKNGYMANKTVYCVCANHDNITPSNYTGDWTTYTGNSKNYVFTKNSGNDVFICLGSSTSNATAPLVDDDITWVEQQLETYRNKRCFLLFHYPFSDYSGNYGNHYGYNMGGTNYTKMKALLEHYPNCIWLSGHSHWDWKYQAEESNANIDRVANNGAWTVHVPSVAYPRQWVNNAVSDNNPGSQCCVVDVYDNYIDIRGLDYDGTSLKYIPIAQYRLDTTLQTVAPNTATITNNLTNCSSNNSAESIMKGSAYTATLTANSGYNLGSITVSMGGTDISSTVVSGSTVTISSVTGNIVISCTATQTPTYTITNNLVGCTNSNSATSLEENSSYSATLTADSGYTLNSVIVTMGGTDITSSAYNSSTNVISISSVTGNIVITATALHSGTVQLPLTWTLGSFNADGSDKDSTATCRTNYIPVDSSHYTYQADFGSNNSAFRYIDCCFYDANYTRISSMTSVSSLNTDTNPLTITPPASAIYMRLKASPQSAYVSGDFVTVCTNTITISETAKQ